MLRITFISLLMVLSKAVLPAVSTVDDAGNTVSLSSPAIRIISLAPHITELMYSIHAGDRLVATVEYSDYPPAAKQVRRVGGHNAIDLESILALQPDLIIA